MGKSTTSSPIDRMYARLVVDDEGCWVWPGSTNGNKVDIGGYGEVRDTVGCKTLLVHLVSYRHHHGDIPPGYEVDHLCHDERCTTLLCKHRRCWNPVHLRATTHTQNGARGNAPGQVTRRTGICKRGHTLAVTGVYEWVRPTGTVRRACKVCADMTPSQRAVPVVA